MLRAELWKGFFDLSSLASRNGDNLTVLVATCTSNQPTYAVNILKCMLQFCFVLQTIQQGSIVMIFQKTDLDRNASLNLINQSFGGKKDLQFPFSDPTQSTMVSYLFSLAFPI